jgi:hypothetical protein
MDNVIDIQDFKDTVLYRGTRDSQGAQVTKANGRPLRLRLDLRQHSPTGFEWGYGGSGPAQLALAILADYLGDSRRALAHYQAFKWDIIARLPRQGWTLTDKRIQQALGRTAPDLGRDFKRTRHERTLER